MHPDSNHLIDIAADLMTPSQGLFNPVRTLNAEILAVGANSDLSQVCSTRYT
jgi:hypothetical protein